MARPQKKGFDYFPLDCDFFNGGSQKIRALKRACGAVGILTYINLLCKVYKNGYYLEFTDINDLAYTIAEEITSTQIAKTASCVLRSINYLADINLIDKDSLKKGGITSYAIQEQYTLSCVKAKRQDHIIKEYKVENSYFDERNKRVNSEETPVNSEFSTQSKSKVKVNTTNVVAVPGLTTEQYSSLCAAISKTDCDYYILRVKAFLKKYPKANFDAYSTILKWHREDVKNGAEIPKVEKTYTSEQLNAMFDDVSDDDM